ncbi:MAG: imidazole glycerol phosphate synthase subunit HisH [Oscillospiraceae bacterium]
MIAIIDYGAGNLHSVKNALDYLGAENIITSSVSDIQNSSGVILPGVGSFNDAMQSMQKSGLVDSVKQAAKSDKPFLGICLGLQLLFEGSEESPNTDGLGILPGKILKIPNKSGIKVPHIGWNSLEITQPNGIFEGLEPEPYVYFVHSYYLQAKNQEDVASNTYYGVKINSAVQRGNLCAVQFHPEKSGEAGLKMLSNFAEMCGEGQ